MKAFVEVMREFGPKLAVILIQLPPSSGIDELDELERLLKALPTDIRCAVEFRNASWGQQRTLDLLREHRVALVVAEYLTRPRQVHLTTDFTYIRWIGEHQRFAELNREQTDVTPSLECWKQEIDRIKPQVTDVFGFFNNDYSGYSIATCRRFMRMMGLEVEDPLEDAAGQGKLFG
jgi:uncharacterized protein YecE (DUF72 family)